MARLPRIVLPGVPHHVTQRGNGRRQTFFEDGDYALYLDLLADAAERAHVEIWSYCLMPNHVHIVNVALERVGNFASFLGEDFELCRPSQSRECWPSNWQLRMAGRNGTEIGPSARAEKTRAKAKTRSAK